MKYGTQFSGTDPLKVASGASHNTALRAYKNLVDLTVDGGTAEAIKVARVGKGCVMDHFVIESSQNLSALTFTIGTEADPDKYGTAVAGPNATAQVRYPLIGVGIAETTEAEDIILTPSGAMPSAGSLRVTTFATHR